VSSFLCSGTLLESLQVFRASRKCWHFVRNRFSFCLCFGVILFHILLVALHELSEPTGHFTLKMEPAVCDSDVRDSFLVPITHEHADCTAVTINYSECTKRKSNELAKFSYSNSHPPQTSSSRAQGHAIFCPAIATTPRRN
jgi:hypothetical protein